MSAPRTNGQQAGSGEAEQLRMLYQERREGVKSLQQSSGIHAAGTVER